ncbi:uncharacterized protein PpBr36_09422 [Pyricularia pennisetigena]|uniref:uncharacterized protein n=1 Tax=Pyricularia pennisetigena TaxID=1578925 RepID=UPI00114ED898|nr:uncharacterized protein PpBr36_09422 [Pyricularia pennisetigena]TLS21807.1 hypothetical protein PpBr36_09422 [Pyricularia pennisetigena]
MPTPGVDPGAATDGVQVVRKKPEGVRDVASLHDVKPSSSLILCYVLGGCLPVMGHRRRGTQENRAQKLGGHSFFLHCHNTYKRDERRRAATTSVGGCICGLDDDGMDQ